MNRKSSKSKKISGNNGAIEEPNFLNPKAISVFKLLWQAFTKVLILQQFDLEYHIGIKTDISDYAIDNVLNQLTSNQLISLNSILSQSDFSQWHSMAYFSRKIILAETC